MSKIKVGTITNVDDTNPVYFPTGVSGDGSNLTFQPNALSFDPVATSTGISTTTNITVIFDQDIEFSGVGTIYIREDSPTGTISTYFTCGVSTEATIAGSTLVIDPRNPLSFNQLYVVTLPSVGIANTFGQYYRGTQGYSFRTAVQSFTAQGGTHEFTIASPTSPTGYHKYHVFTATGILTTTSPSVDASDLSALLVAGGGGGGAGYYSPVPRSFGAGGGGSGGLLSYTGPTLALNAGTYTITIGAGGIGTTGNNSSIAPPTGPSYITTYGGGGGGWTNPGDLYGATVGLPGGSGGGGRGGPNTPTPGGSGVPGQGNSGGSGVTQSPYPYPAPTGGTGAHLGGGGGGAGGAGGNSSSYTSPATGYNGGVGGNGSPNTSFTSPLISSYVPTIPVGSWTKIGPTGLYAGGGGGTGMVGPWSISFGLPYGGSGGPGGGGQGAETPVGPVNQGENGYQGTGGGGGGGGFPNGSNGGSGVFMIRYAVPAP